MKPSPTQYPQANVHPGAKVGERVTVSAYVTIEDDVVIGDDCYIGPNAVLMAGTRLGARCRIFPGAVLGAEPQDLKFDGEYTQLVVGHDTTVREYCTLNRGTKAAGTTVVGDHCLLMAYVHIAHDCQIGNQVVIANNVNLAGHVEIGDHAVLGGNSACHQFVKVGTHAMVGGASLVRKDVPPFITVAREPVRFISVNKTGLTRRDFTPAQIRDIERAYRIFFSPGFSRQEALDLIDRDLPNSAERHTIIEFVRNSERGVIRGPQHESNGED